MARAAIKTTHQQRLEEQATLAFDAMAAQTAEQLLSVSEERNLAHCLPKLAEMAEQMGMIDKPLRDWGRKEVMQLFAMVVRCANPFLSPPDAAAYREFNDTIPF